MIRLVASGLAAIPALLAGSALAQAIEYQTEGYEYPRSDDVAQDDDVVTEAATPVAPAARVILERRSGPAPVFVSHPVVQPLTGSSPVVVPVTAPAQVSEPAIPAPLSTAAPVLYAYPTVSAPTPGLRSPGSDPALVAASPYELPQGYIMATSPLPAGAQLVAFDRGAWLGACRQRLETYRPEDRAAALAALGGAALGYREGYDGCETYLDSYLAQASVTPSAMSASHAVGQAYMLVPVTVAVQGAPQPK